MMSEDHNRAHLDPLFHVCGEIQKPRAIYILLHTAIIDLNIRRYVAISFESTLNRLIGLRVYSGISSFRDSFRAGSWGEVVLGGRNSSSNSNASNRIIYESF